MALPQPPGEQLVLGVTCEDPQRERGDLCGSRHWQSWRRLKEEKDERQWQRGKL